MTSSVNGVDVGEPPLHRDFLSQDMETRKQAARESVKKGRWGEFHWHGPPSATATKIVEDSIVCDGEMKRKHRSAMPS